MHIQDGKVIPTTRACWCEDGTVPGRKACETCHGTGRGKRGGKGGCRQCHGFKTQADFANRVPCDRCDGTQRVEETLYDYMPDELWKALDFKIYRQDRAISWNESHLGAGCVFSCCDYGRNWKANDPAALIAEVKEKGSHQAITIAKRDGTLCHHVGIFVNRDGYSVRAVFADDPAAPLRDIAREPNEEDGRAIGMAVYRRGGNGTMAAAGR